MKDILMTCLYALIGALFISPFALWWFIDDSKYKNTPKFCKFLYCIVYPLKAIFFTGLLIALYVAFYAACKYHFV